MSLILCFILCLVCFMLGFVLSVFISFKVNDDIAHALSASLRECESLKKRLFEIEIETDMPPFDILLIRRIAQGVENEREGQEKASE